MKKNYFIFLLAIFFSGIAIAQDPQKTYINYQGVARNGADQIMANEAMTIGIALKVGSTSVAAAYVENHSVTTDANGVFSLRIGSGKAVSGDYYNIPWGSAATFVTVSINGSEIGTTEMMAVPYALSSGDAPQRAHEVPYDNAASGLTATNTQEAIDELVGGSTVDADADPTNELQTISFDVASNQISLTDGGTITIPSGGTDADADPTNELQNLAFDALTNELSLTSGNSIVIPTAGVDGDADSTNELQTISFNASTNELSLSDGGTVTIPSGATDADADPTNELQDISLSGTDLTISDGSTLDLSAIIPPGGTDDQNADEVPYDNTASGLTATNSQAAIDELAASGVVDTDNQILTFDATTNLLEIEDGNTVNLSSLASGGSSLWTQDGSSISYTSGRVGIGAGSESSNALLEVAGGANSEGILNIKDTEIIGYNLAINGFGLQGRFDGANSSLFLNRGGGNIYMGRNVGIGISGSDSPEAALDVAGRIRSRNLTGSGERNVVADADGNLVIGAGGGGSSPWGESAGNIHYNTGNVGMGTDTPSARNHIKHNSSTASPQLLLEEEGSDFARLAFKNESSTAFWNIAGFSRNGASNGTNDSRLSFYFANDAETGNKMSILGNGNVGINTTSPNSKLDVAGDINTSGEVHRTATGNANLLPIAYGTIEGDGRILNSSGNLSVIKRASGLYAITLNDNFLNPNEHTVITSPCSLMLNDMRSYFSADDSGRYIIATYGVSGLEDYRFSVMIFKP